jgi:hypothetical protein
MFLGTKGVGIVGGMGTVLGASGMFWSSRYFVEIDSYAIASLATCSEGGNSMGLILDARGSPSFSLGL